jgi:hypothetical protein
LNSAYSQNDSNKENPTPPIENSSPVKVQSQKQMKIEKSSVTNKTVKVDPIKLEKKKAVIKPEEKAKIEEKYTQKKKKEKVKF